MWVAQINIYVKLFKYSTIHESENVEVNTKRAWHLFCEVFLFRRESGLLPLADYFSPYLDRNVFVAVITSYYFVNGCFGCIDTGSHTVCSMRFKDRAQWTYSMKNHNEPRVITAACLSLYNPSPRTTAGPSLGPTV